MERVRRPRGASRRRNARARNQSGRRRRGVPLQLSGVLRGVLRRAEDPCRAFECELPLRQRRAVVTARELRGEGPLLRRRAPRQRHVGRGAVERPASARRGRGRGRSPVPNALAYEELLAAAEPAARIERDDDDVFLSYTGGTTGLPKGVLFNIGQSLGNSFWFRDLFVGGEPTTLDAVDFAVQEAERGSSLSAIPASPLMHSTGFIFASLPTLTAGGLVTTLVSRSFDAHELLATVETTGASVVGIVGDAFALPIVHVLDEGKPGAGRYDTSSLRVICSAGVAWSAHVKARLLDHIPSVMLLDSCGSTEGVAYGLRQVPSRRSRRDRELRCRSGPQGALPGRGGAAARRDRNARGPDHCVRIPPRRREDRDDVLRRSVASGTRCPVTLGGSSRTAV